MLKNKHNSPVIARNSPVMFVTPKRSVLLGKLTQLGSLSNDDGNGNENGKRQ